MSWQEKIHFYTPEQKQYLEKLVRAIQDHYQEDLISLAIFGSMAGKTNRLNSDCDLVLVLENDKIKNRQQKMREFLDIEFSLSEWENKMYDSGVCMEVSQVIFSKEQASFFNPMYLDMTESCVIISDKENFLKQILQRVRQKMQEWGSKKEYCQGGWKWLIKPGIKWGEKISYDLR